MLGSGVRHLTRFPLGREGGQPTTIRFAFESPVLPDSASRLPTVSPGPRGTAPELDRCL